ncbi:unnamed protein product [Closterium sp. Naga37s-1]|nr:unnamed protein product [Closterium sp. Naga37s-1]
MTLRSVQRGQRRSSTGAQPAQRAPSHNEKRSGTPDAARAGGRYKRRKTLSDARATRGRSAEEPDDGERPARRASLRVAAGGKDGTRKAKRKEREEKPVSLILPPIPSSAGPLFQVRAGLTDFRARQLAMAVEAGVTSEVVWALNALQLISFSLKDTWQQGAGPLSKAPQLLSALVSVLSLSAPNTPTLRNNLFRLSHCPASRAAPSRNPSPPLLASIPPIQPIPPCAPPLPCSLYPPPPPSTYFPLSAGPPLPARPISALHPPSADDPLASAAAAAAAGAGGMSAYGRGHRGGGVESRGGEAGVEAGGGRGEDGGGLAAGGAAGGVGGKAEAEETGEGGAWEGPLSAEEREVWWAERALFNHSSSASSTGGDGGGGGSSSSAGERLQCAVAASSVLRNLSFLPHCASAMAALPACVAMLVGAMEDFQRGELPCWEKEVGSRISAFSMQESSKSHWEGMPTPLKAEVAAEGGKVPEEEEVVSNTVDTFANIAAAIDLSSYPTHTPPLPSSATPLASAPPLTLAAAAAAPPASLTRSAAAHPGGDTGLHGIAVGASGSGADAGADAAAGGEGSRGVMSVERVLAALAALLQGPVVAWQAAAAEAWGRLLLCRDNDLLLLPAAGPLQVYRQVALLLASADPHVQATALSCIALAAHASPAAKYCLARQPHLLSRLLSLVTAPHPLRRVVRRAAATLVCLAREPRTHAAFQPLLPSLTRAAFASAPPAPHAATAAPAAAAAAAAGDAAATGGDGGGGGKEKGGGDAEVSAALAEVVWRVSCEPGADDWRLPEGENVWGARECDM